MSAPEPSTLNLRDAVEVPIATRDEKRFVELAVVEKKFVVVAEVPVAFANVKF